MTRKPRLHLSPPHMSGYELPLIQEAFDTNWIAPLGPHVDAFERELPGVQVRASVPGGLVGSRGERWGD